MREILFRGKSKSINKGEWIYGSFVEETDLNTCCIRDKSLVYELVDRETVCLSLANSLLLYKDYI